MNTLVSILNRVAMKNYIPFALLFLLIGISFSCKKKKDPEPVVVPTPTPTPSTLVYSFSGNIDGVPTSWTVDNSNYKMSMSPYNSMNVSTSNNWIRYGTSIWTNVPSQVPFIGVDFSGFHGNSIDQVTPTTFINRFQVGAHPYGTAANKDSIGVNIFYQNSTSVLYAYESANYTQPSSSYFNLDSVLIIQEPNKNTNAWVKISFECTVKNPTTNGLVFISNGVLKVKIDNYLEP
jgi:hypothetical protein